MSNIPGPKHGLNEIIDAFTQQIIEKRSQDNKYNPLRPSSAGRCERELGYEYMEFKGLAKYDSELSTPSVHRLLNLGHSIEYHANNELRAALALAGDHFKIKYKQQSVTVCRFEDGTLMEGNIDLWIETPEWRCIADWKSKGEKYSSYYKTNWDEFVDKLTSTGFATSFGEDAVFITDLEKFLEGHQDAFFNNNLYQLNQYACTDFAKERNVTFCSILQYNKNSSQIREVRFLPSQAIANKTIEKFKKVHKVITEEKSPENLTKEYMLGSSKCGFCKYRKECWEKDDALKTYFKTLPPKAWAKDLDRLPSDVQAELSPLFEEYHRLASETKNLDKIEEKIVKALDKAKVYKIRLNKDQIYRVKDLKTGGPGGGPQRVLRRDKA